MASIGKYNVNARDLDGSPTTLRVSKTQLTDQGTTLYMHEDAVHKKKYLQEVGSKRPTAGSVAGMTLARYDQVEQRRC